MPCEYVNTHILYYTWCMYNVYIYICVIRPSSSLLSFLSADIIAVNYSRSCKTFFLAEGLFLLSPLYSLDCITSFDYTDIGITYESWKETNFFRGWVHFFLLENIVICLLVFFFYRIKVKLKRLKQFLYECIVVVNNDVI